MVPSSEEACLVTRAELRTSDMRTDGAVGFTFPLPQQGPGSDAARYRRNRKPRIETESALHVPPFARRRLPTGVFALRTGHIGLQGKRSYLRSGFRNVNDCLDKGLRSFLR